MEIWIISAEGLICYTAAAVFYLIGISCESEAEYLKSVIPIRRLKDLAPLLDAATTVLPYVVGVSGLVGSDTPIKCKYSDVRAVIVEKTEKNHFKKRNDKGDWEKVTEYLWPSKRKSVPWYLGDGEDRVYVTGACCASGLPLTLGGKVFKAPRLTLECALKLEEQGIKMLGVEKIEKVLPLNRYLTVVGEATKDCDGKIQISPPYGGGFYVTEKTLGELIQSKLSCSSFCKFVSVGLLVVGVCFFAKPAFDPTYVYIRRMILQKMRTRGQNQIAQRDLGLGYILPHADAHRILPGHAVIETRLENKGSTSKADNRPDMDEDLCGICSEQEYNSVFIPCGHKFCCMTCSIPLKRCPICVARIEGKVRAFCS